MSAFTAALGYFREVSSFQDPRGGQARCLAVLSGPARLAVGYTDGRLQLFDPEEPGPWEFAADSFCVHALAATQDGSVLACAGQDGGVLRQADRGQRLARKKGEVKSLAFLPGSDLLAMGGMDGEVRFLAIKDTQKLSDFMAHSECIEALAFSPEKRWLATAGLDGVKLWHWGTGLPFHEFDVGGSCPKALAFTEEDSTLAVGCDDGVIRCFGFDMESGGPRGVLSPERENAGVWTLALSPDGTVLAAGCEDGRIRLWGHASGTLLRTLEGHADAVLSLAWESDTLLASAGRDGSVRLWSSELPTWTLPGGRPQPLDREEVNPLSEEDLTAEVHDLGEHAERVTALAFHPQGSLLVSADASGHLLVRDVSGEGETVSLHAHEGEVSRLGFSPDGALLVTASTAGGLRVLEVDTGEERAHGTHPGPVVALAFHPEQPMLFTGGGGTVCFWDVRPGREASSQPLNEVPGEVTGLAMRPDGRGLAVSSQSGSSATIHLVPLGKEKPRRLWTFPELRVQSMAFSPDGTRLAVGLADGRVHLWKVDSASVLQSLYCGKKPVHFLEFSPDGEGLVTASGDLLRLWRLEGEKTLFWAEEGFSTCASAVFPPEGGLLLANAIGARVRLRVFSADGDD